MNEDLKYFARSHAQPPLHIPLAGVTYPSANYVIKRPHSNCSVIEYVTDGVGYVVWEGQIRTVCRDMIYFLPQEQDHYYYADSEAPYQKIFLNLSGPFCRSMIAAYGLTGQCFFDGGALKPVFEKIPAIIHSDMPENAMQAALQGVFMEILSQLSLSQQEQAYDSDALKLKNYLDMNLHRLVSGKELAGVIFRSQDHCQKLFLRKFHTTPYAYHIDAKMQKAKVLLTNTNLSVGEIAASLGYNDAHYFSNLFQKKCNCRPSAYRKYF